MNNATRYIVYYWYERFGKWIEFYRTYDREAAEFEAESMKKILKTRTRIEERLAQPEKG